MLTPLSAVNIPVELNLYILMSLAVGGLQVANWQLPYSLLSGVRGISCHSDQKYLHYYFTITLLPLLLHYYRYSYTITAIITLLLLVYIIMVIVIVLVINLLAIYNYLKIY